MVKIFVGGFPPKMSELELVQLLDPYGQVVTIKLVRDKVSKKSKGYAFVEMTDLDGAERAIIALDGAEFGENHLSVNFATEPAATTYGKPKFGKPKPSFSPSQADDKKRPRRPRN